MQRWIILGLVGVVLGLCGGYFGLKAHKQNRPGPIWVPLPISVDSTKQQRDEITGRLKEYMIEEQRLLAIVRDLQLKNVWSLSSDEAAAAELKKRIFVRIGSAPTSMGDIPAIHVGLNGTQKEIPMTTKIVTRMMDDVRIAINGPDVGD